MIEPVQYAVLSVRRAVFKLVASRGGCGERGYGVAVSALVALRPFFGRLLEIAVARRVFGAAQRDPPHRPCWVACGQVASDANVARNGSDHREEIGRLAPKPIGHHPTVAEPGGKSVLLVDAHVLPGPPNDASGKPHVVNGSGFGVAAAPPRIEGTWVLLVKGHAGFALGRWDASRAARLRRDHRRAKRNYPNPLVNTEVLEQCCEFHLVVG
mmetsp:Transcript_3220/g.7859  ORF Transcript_3220/g.7859 Transcript_3220/m.7859 type:complete len:212 (-) Transcript_3220:166-801(-)